MNKIGPAIFCFALLSVIAACLFPDRGVILFVIACAVVASASLGWGVYSLVHRRWSGLFFLLLGIVEFIMLSPALHTR